MLEELKEKVCRMNKELPKNNLVTMTSGNVSGRDPESNLVVIKHSGVSFEEMNPADMVVVNLEGEVVEGEYRASTDTESHVYVYRHRHDVMGIVHTHSNYATSFAALGKGIPCYLTAIADEFGGDIPAGPYATIGGEEIGEAIVEHIGDSRAILLKSHGVFTVGPGPEEALKAAVMVEDVAKTVHLAMMKGELERLPQEEIDKAHDRYMNRYGQ
ncbi:MAG: L-ribulose-5-phosphate 4-epimerase [Halanaerobiales bacterium]